MAVKFLICENIFYSFFVKIIIGASTTSFIFASGTPFFGKTNGSTFKKKVNLSLKVSP